MTPIAASEITYSPGLTPTRNTIKTKTNPETNDKKNISLACPESVKERRDNAIYETNIRVNELCDAQESELNELKNARVKLAKKQFFINVLESVVSLASFTVAVGLTVCSGGVATPIAVITGLNLMLSLSNLACAYHNWNCASKNKDELEMGSDAIQQAVFMLATHYQASPMKAKTIARFTSFLIRAGIAVSLGVIGGLIHPDINNSLCILAKNYIPILGSMVTIIGAGALGAWMSHDSDSKDAIIEKLVTIEIQTAEKLAFNEGQMRGNCRV
ncbi:hypothetical protein J8Z83_21260 [Yersinia enterocolitica]|uniref:hypothetical protein n=1 Tax=Yersinia enterocolitica TaxID=630 RepID=UPI001C8EDDD7|nr:hypothetical protein [Yersinia enterocolitica]MBX9477178.1 hypothetical protein [Yersinia enterocolitica]